MICRGARVRSPGERRSNIPSYTEEGRSARHSLHRYGSVAFCACSCAVRYRTPGTEPRTPAPGCGTRAPRGDGLAGGRLGNMRSGEIPFALPIKLRVNGRANVRSGPGTTFAVSFTAESNSTLSGISYLGDWIRVTNDAGNEGWILRSLVVRRVDTSR